MKKDEINDDIQRYADMLKSLFEKHNGAFFILVNDKEFKADERGQVISVQAVCKVKEFNKFQALFAMMSAMEITPEDAIRSILDIKNAAKSITIPITPK